MYLQGRSKGKSFFLLDSIEMYEMACAATNQRFALHPRGMLEYFDCEDPGKSAMLCAPGTMFSEQCQSCQMDPTGIIKNSYSLRRR